MSNPEYTVIAGEGQAHTAEPGTPLPAGPESVLHNAFTSLGLHTNEGAGINRSEEILRLRAWGKRGDVRRKRQSQAFQITFGLEEWSEPTVKLAFGGGEIEEVEGGYKYVPADLDDDMYDRSLVLDLEDGARIMKFVVPKGNAVESVSSSFAGSAGSILPITFEALYSGSDDVPDWFFLDNSDAFATGS